MEGKRKLGVNGIGSGLKIF